MRKKEDILFKPLINSALPLPRHFENFEIEKEGKQLYKIPHKWFTRSTRTVSYNKSSSTVLIASKPDCKWNFVGSFEATLSKGYVSNKNFIEIDLKGKGWISVKLSESTVTDGGVSMIHGSSWKKLDTVREKEILLFNEKRRTVRFRIDKMYNKPFNVSLKAFLKGFKKVDINRIGSVEITVRRGWCKFYSFNFSYAGYLENPKNKNGRRSSTLGNRS